MKADDATYRQQIQDLIAFLRNEFPENHPYQEVRAMPDGPEVPAFWLPGAGPSGVKIAAKMGLSFCFAQFIRSTTEPEILQTYRQMFRPGALQDKPNAILAVRVICAETEKQAQSLAHEYWLTALSSIKRSAGRFLWSH